MENHDIINNLVDEIILNGKKVSAVSEAPEFFDSIFYENNLYQVEKIILEDTKDKPGWRKHSFEFKKKIDMGLKSETTW